MLSFKQDRAPAVPRPLRGSDVVGLAGGEIGPDLHCDLTFSESFLDGYMLGFLIVMNFAGFRAISHRFTSFLRPVKTPIRSLAGITFTLYLLHQQVIVFFASVLKGSLARAPHYLAVMGLMFLTVLAIGRVTELKNDLARRLAEGLFDHVHAILPTRRT